MATVQKIKKRNGEIVDFQPEKITIAVKKAFAAVLGDAHDADAAEVTKLVASAVDAKYSGTQLLPTVEEIQDLVENAIAGLGYFGVAKAYIIYRYEHEKIRQEKKQEIIEKISENALTITKRDGRTERFSESKLTRTLMRAAQGFDRIVDTPAIIARVRQEMHEGIKTKDIHEVLIMVTRSFIERDPAYSLVASRLLLQSIYREVMGDIDWNNLDDQYRRTFAEAIQHGVKIGQFDPRMLDFDLPRLADTLQIERDREFKYLGL
ncbi:MAG TPA: ATP cone domain-containing protein, partial [Candidatus Paceibacterota bacterium]|nr:ATP cone domain-containing protein [Candidatus Paceibacterota bacterium]